MMPQVPQDVHHTVEEPSGHGDPRRPRSGTIDAVALVSRPVERPEPVRVVGDEKLKDVVPMRFGPPPSTRSLPGRS
jgi:hypothetical protein